MHAHARRVLAVTLGPTACEVARNLGTHFDLAKQWDCVYCKTRRTCSLLENTTDVKWSALVLGSVFNQKHNYLSKRAITREIFRIRTVDTA